MEPVRVWSPGASRIDLILGERRVPMARDTGGWFRGPVLDAGTDYAISIDGGPPRPDPRSRWQPAGVHGPSRWIASPGSAGARSSAKRCGDAIASPGSAGARRKPINLDGEGSREVRRFLIDSALAWLRDGAGDVLLASKPMASARELPPLACALVER